MSERKLKNDLFGTFRHASYSVQKHEPSIPSEDNVTAYPSTPLMGGPTKEDKENFKNYPLTPEKTTKGKSRGSYNLVESGNAAEHKESTWMKTLLISVCVCLVVLLLILIGVWMAFFLGGGDCEGKDCNVTVGHSNETLLFASAANLNLNYALSNETESDMGDVVSISEVAVSSLSLDCTSQYSDAVLAAYQKYMDGKKKTSKSNKSKCESLESFNSSRSQIDSLNEKFKPQADFGLTVFSDWNEAEKAETGTGSTSSDDFEQRPSYLKGTKTDTIVNYLEHSYSIVFDDKCPRKWNLKMALKTISENIQNDNKSKEPRTTPQKSCQDVDDLYELNFLSKRKDSDSEPIETEKDDSRKTFTTYLLETGPFVTPLLVSGNFFDYKNGTFNTEMCEDEAMTVIYVLVVGNGERKDPRTGETVQFWHIMPVGEVWKNWGNGGYMRLDVNACVPPSTNAKLIAYLPAGSSRV